MALKQVTFEIEEDLFKKFAKKCIDLGKTKREVLTDLIDGFVRGK